MSGFDLTEKVRSDRLPRHVPVILVAALDSMEDRAHGADVGADAYITKGVFTDELSGTQTPELRLSVRPAEPATAQRPEIPHSWSTGPIPPPSGSAARIASVTNAFP